MRSTIVLFFVLVLGLTRAQKTTGTIYNGTFANDQEFDYIVVGAGLAGLAVAARLSEDNVTVLVIEAGQDSGSDPRVKDIYEYGSGFEGDLAWNFKTESGGDLYAGKTVGGSTAINAGLWTRGGKDAYDALPLFLGEDVRAGRWGWVSMFSYMKKAEIFGLPKAELQNAGVQYNRASHGQGGKVQVTYPDEMYTGSHQVAFQQALAKHGVPISKDAFGGDAAVSAVFPLTLDRHNNFTRASSRYSYWAALEHTTTTMGVLVGHQVIKILTNNTQGTIHATGVQYQAANGTGTVFQANARREVILAAGAIKTPHVLLLSGIGPKNELEDAGVDVVLDRPGVGKNLQDQTMNIVHWVKKRGYEYGGKGPSNVAAYLNIDVLTFNKSDGLAANISNGYKGFAADAVAAGAMVNTEGAQKAFEIQAGLMTNKGIGLAELAMEGEYPDGGFGIKVWNLLPFSRGYVRLADNDPNTDPLIDPRYFTAETDMQIQVQGCRAARNAFMTEPLSELVKEEEWPGFDAVNNTTDMGEWDSWESQILENYVGVSHQLGTCAMMAEEWGGVVSGNLTIYGTDNIRVVDASVLPMQISAHLMNTLYGVAENAADIIKERWQQA